MKNKSSFGYVLTGVRVCAFNIQPNLDVNALFLSNLNSVLLAELNSLVVLDVGRESDLVSHVGGVLVSDFWEQLHELGANGLVIDGVWEEVVVIKSHESRVDHRFVDPPGDSMCMPVLRWEQLWSLDWVVWHLVVDIFEVSVRVETEKVLSWFLLDSHSLGKVDRSCKVRYIK